MRTIVMIALLAFAVSSCNNSSTTEQDNTTSGQIQISVDETYYPLVKTELDVFHGFYKYAAIEAQYLPETEAMQLLISDSVRLAIVTRTLTEAEQAYFDQRKLIPRITKVAIDAVALIVHPDNPDTIISLDQLRQLLAGNPTAWKVGATDSNSIQVVFDNSNSSTVRYLKEKFSPDFAPYCFAVNTNPEVINYVANNPKAVGIIGVSWISDTDDSVSYDFLSKVKVLRISSETTGPRGLQPYQAYIADSSYPLIRSLYIVSREARAGLGTGFASFMASDKGQRIVLKSGLVPATMPVRIVEFKN